MHLAERAGFEPGTLGTEEKETSTIVPDDAGSSGRIVTFGDAVGPTIDDSMTKADPRVAMVSALCDALKAAYAAGDERTARAIVATLTGLQEQ